MIERQDEMNTYPDYVYPKHVSIGGIVDAWCIIEHLDIKWKKASSPVISLDGSRLLVVILRLRSLSPPLV